MREEEALIGAVLEEACLTLEQAACACAVAPEWLAERVREGLLRAMEGPAHAWRFTSADVRRARRMAHIERVFEADPALAALVADLLEELDALRARAHHAGLQ
jgi:chaperone modulatory protein CbpM